MVDLLTENVNLILAGLCVVLSLLAILALARKRSTRERLFVENCIAQLKMLRTLLTELQRHRGLTTALLSGDRSLQAEQQRCVSLVDRIERDALVADLVLSKQWMSVINQWQSLKQLKATDPQVNLKRHNLLIRQVIYLIEDIYSELLNRCQDSQLGIYRHIFYQVVQTAEWSGQARALGTGMLAQGLGTPSQRVRMRFLHNKIRTLSNEALGGAKQAPGSDLYTANCKRSIDRFLINVEREVLGEQPPELQPRQYFESATQAVEDLLKLMDWALVEMTNRLNRTN